MLCSLSLSASSCASCVVNSRFVSAVQIATSGIDLQVTKGPGGSQTITITRKDGQQTVTETIATSIVKTSSYASRLVLALGMKTAENKK